GEHMVVEVVDDGDQGPSPRARGAQGRVPAGDRESGTIPACAGSTRGSRSGTRRRRDHPRVRGEHLLTWWSEVEGAGPSPRARGARHVLPGRQVPAGTIPACAGSTVYGCVSLMGNRDHPRVRGEHIVRPEPYRR